MSAGVARQYLGRFGKVDNGQVGTFLAHVTREEHVLVNAKLFIPQEWNDDPERCERAHIPKEEYETHKTRHEHCLEMLDEQDDLWPHKWITGDEEWLIVVERPEGNGVKYDYYFKGEILFCKSLVLTFSICSGETVSSSSSCFTLLIVPKLLASPLAST